MKRTLLYVGIILAAAVGSVAVYQPAVLAQVAGFFSSISVTSGGTLNGTFGGTATFTNPLIASITGNAGTATALAATPTQCSGGTPVASGIAANGDANCTSGAPTFTGASGYQVLPSGLILEWGETTNFDTGPTTVTFPLPFPHACLMPPQLTDNMDVSTIARIWLSGSCTVNNFQARNDGLGQAHWLAIGY